MTGRDTPGRRARAERGWLSAHQWLLARRVTQSLVVAIFLAGPVAGLWVIKGNLAASLVLGIVPLTDPLVLLQSLAAGHWPKTTAITGALIVLGFYVAVGGRAYCAWVCPLNAVTDVAHWARQKLGIKGGAHVSPTMRYSILGLVLTAAFLTGSLAWELINPVTAVFRALVFGIGAAWTLLAAVFLIDLFIGRRLWCGHLCPVGAFYSLPGLLGIARVSARHRERCDDCMDCYAICPDPQVITPALKGAAAGKGPVILSPNCTNCGRCIDVCPEQVFVFATRFHDPRGRRSPAAAGPSPSSERRAA